MALNQALSVCDPSSVDDLMGVYRHFSTAKRFELQLVACLAEQKVYRAASWLLKHHLEQGFALSDKQTLNTLTAYMDMKHWEARLHILQCFGFFSIPEVLVLPLYSQLRHQLSDNKKFVRAWTYNALHELARQYPQHHKEVKALLQVAQEDEVASVKARIRKILKTGAYD